MARKAPIRTCVACGESSEKRTLVRFVRTPQGEIKLDRSGKEPGRGAYVCSEAACFEKACEKHLFDKRLRMKISEEDRKRLKAEFDEHEKQK